MPSICRQVVHSTVRVCVCAMEGQGRGGRLPPVPIEEVDQLVSVLRLRQASVEQRCVDPSGARTRFVHSHVHASERRALLADCVG